mgnify:CR=1 FL=1
MSADTKELRGDAPTELVTALDALALAKDLTRHAYVVEVLSAHVNRELLRHIVETNALRGNPLLAALSRHRSDS